LIALSGAGSQGAAASTPVEGSQGTNTALPLTSSAVTVKGRDVLGANSPFANLVITVNQTKSLTNQAVSVTWKGGTPTNADLPTFTRFDDNYLQIFECWGADDHTNPHNPGPPPTGCEFGANMLSGATLGLSDSGGGPISRQLGGGDTSPYAYVDPDGGTVYMPFRPVDGTAPINVPTRPSTDPNNPTPVWANSYFDYTTSNEVDYARTYPNGTGSAVFTVDTGLEAPGLGCGEKVSQPDGSALSPRCWLVIVPRGSSAFENPVSAPSLFVQTSAVSGAAWAHRVAIPLSFNPIGSSCRLGADERRIVGSELVVSAISSWEPTLCASPSSPPYQYSPISDDQARLELPRGTAGGGPGMAVMSRPIDPTTVSPANPVTYAPLSLSAVVIAFNVDRMLNPVANDPAEQSLHGEPVQHIYLTPRLVAKLLTESYVDQFFHLSLASIPSGYQWLKNNPITLVSDPDFLQFNPEFPKLQCTVSPSCGGLIVEQPTSDASYELWRWILADPEARAWLNGTADPWGMRVNPFYSTNAKVNPGGVAFGTPTPDGFPKSDSYTYQSDIELPAAGFQKPRPLGMQDAMPYALSMQAAALAARTANMGAKTTLNPGATSKDTAWGADGPLGLSQQFDMSVTDSADAAQYGLQTASLSRAGDDRPNRAFVAPDTAGIEAGQQAMVPTSVPFVVQPNVSTSMPGAYPLSTLSYGALTPLSLDKQSCHDYAALIDYAVGRGQVPGVNPGQLPPGYAPLGPELVGQSLGAAQAIISFCGKTGTGQPPLANTGRSSGSGSHSGTGSSSASGTGAGSSGSGPGAGTGSSTTTATGTPTGATSTTASHGTRGSATPRGNATLSATSGSTRGGNTSGVAFALTRLVLPILVAVGLIAVLGARWLDVWPRRVRRPPTPK
jgi:hypothetical protein